MSDPLRGPATGRREPADRRTERWRGVVALALVAGGIGVLVGRPALLLAGALGVTVAAYAGFASPPAVDLELDRTVDSTAPDPGEPVEVRLTVRNAGDALLPDLRIVDGVPAGLAVVSGSPRLGTALRPGKTASVAYTVRAARGEHSFDPATVLARDLTGSVERETTARVETALRCVPPLAEGVPLPLRTQTSGYTGRVATDTGGAGTEFHAVREYRHGDSLSRVDWRRLARTGDPATVEFRTEQAATIVLVVDTRAAAHRAGPDGRSVVERSVAAAGEAFTSLLSTGDRVGLAAFGPEGAWLAPGTGEGHRARARSLLATDDAFAGTPPDEPFIASFAFGRLRRRLPADAQVVLFSPVRDDYAVDVARRLDAYGHRVTVVSPDPTGAATAGQCLARAERSVRLSTLRGADIRVIDWDGESLATAFARAGRRWGT